LRLLPEPPAYIEAGEIRFEGRDLLQLSQEELRRVRGRKIAMIFQEPMTSLNPVFTIGSQIDEALRLHTDLDRAARRARVIQLLETVGISEAESRLRDYPHQLSGGMRQRVMIAMALACNPAVLIADEPTTALDVTIQAQILALLDELKARFRMSVLLITHDLGVVAESAQRVAIFYAGRVVEIGPVEAIYREPRHPYTQGLLLAMPGANTPRGTRLQVIPGSVPDLAALPSGCRFRGRCPRETPRCAVDDPRLERFGPERAAACWNPLPAPEAA
jgi:oligopeptide/dipeptide ABC transporter ATP-binding protein